MLTRLLDELNGEIFQTSVAECQVPPEDYFQTQTWLRETWRLCAGKLCRPCRVWNFFDD
jgi:hypothetical protein